MKYMRIVLAVSSLLGLLLTIGWTPFSTAHAFAADSSYGNCRNVQLKVALAVNQPTSQTIAATYCEPNAWSTGPREVDVMTPGATYNSSYWNWPVDPALYSYVDKTLGAGRATFDYDRIGTGASSHPRSTDIAIDNEAYILHQIVSWLRNSLAYSQVNLIGHSLGSVISIQEAGLYQDVDRVIVTGLLHVPAVGAGFASTLLSLVYPAVFDSQYVGERLDLDYLTTIPGDRSLDFYSAAADPAVIAYDEAHKDVVPLTDLTSLATTWALPADLNVSDRITAPVLVVIGQQDAIFCTAPPLVGCAQPAELLAVESPYYAAAASLTVDAVSDTGHDIALHPSADRSFALINQWVTTH